MDGWAVNEMDGAFGWKYVAYVWGEWWWIGCMDVCAEWWLVVGGGDGAAYGVGVGWFGRVGIQWGTMRWSVVDGMGDRVGHSALLLLESLPPTISYGCVYVRVCVIWCVGRGQLLQAPTSTRPLNIMPGVRFPPPRDGSFRTPCTLTPMP